MSTINRQLGIPLLKDGESMYQKDMYNRPLEMDSGYDSAYVKGTVYLKANGECDKKVGAGWDNCSGGCGSFNNAEGSALYNSTHNTEVCFNKCIVLHPFNKAKRDACKKECQVKYNTTTLAGLMTEGMTPTDAAKFQAAIPTALGGTKPTISGDTRTVVNSDGSTGQSSVAKTGGMSKGAIIGLGVGAVAIIGLGVWYFKFRKK